MKSICLLLCCLILMLASNNIGLADRHDNNSKRINEETDTENRNGGEGGAKNGDVHSSRQPLDNAEGRENWNLRSWNGITRTPRCTSVQRNCLSPGKSLAPGQSIVSTSGKFELIYQGDGNLVIYQIDALGPHAIWATYTMHNNPLEAVMQGDGNFVTYLTTWQATFNTGTAGHPGAYLVMQDDGNLVVYLGSKALWDSNTVRPTTGVLLPGESLTPGQSLVSASGQYFLAYQGDGNLVIYENAGSSTHAIWATYTIHNNPLEAVMQVDGNFVTYLTTGQATFNTGTEGHPGAYLFMQDDGNLVVYLGEPIPQNALWNSHTK